MVSRWPLSPSLWRARSSPISVRPGRHLQSHRVQHMTVANRTLARAQGLASQWQADVITLNEIPNVLPEVDVVVSSTASPLPLLGKGLMERVLKQRRHRPMLLIEAECGGKKGTVFLQNAETIRMVRADGRPVSVVDLQVGDKVLCRTDQAGRHFGMRITEEISE